MQCASMVGVCTAETMKYDPQIHKVQFEQEINVFKGLSDAEMLHNGCRQDCATLKSYHGSNYFIFRQADCEVNSRNTSF